MMTNYPLTSENSWRGEMKSEMPKKSALKGLIKTMKALNLEKIEGYRKKDDPMPSMSAVKGPRDEEEEE